MSKYDERMKELEAELELCKNTWTELNIIIREIHKRNEYKLNDFFKKNGIDYHIFYRENWRGSDKTEQSYTIELNASEKFSNIEFNVLYDDSNFQWSSFRMQGEKMDENNLKDFENHLRNIHILISILKDNSDFVKVLRNFEKKDIDYEKFFKEKNIRYERLIQDDIEKIKNLIIEENLDIHPGRELYVCENANKPSKQRWGYDWNKATIVKINKKSIQYVIHFENGNTSDVKAIPYVNSYFKTIEQMNALTTGENAKLMKRVSPYN